MEVTLRTDEITLSVNGRKMTFFEEELIDILEEHFKFKEANVNQMAASKSTQIPTEGKWFQVNPLKIDQNLFREKKSDSMQEMTRMIILEAFEEMKNNPKYSKNFKTIIPKKTWSGETVSQLKMFASKLGDHNADWVEQSLEWAQRISNGESWEDICNKPDTAKWCRMVTWENTYARLVGGSSIRKDNSAACNVNVINYRDYERLDAAVPLIVFYDA